MERPRRMDEATDDDYDLASRTTRGPSPSSTSSAPSKQLQNGRDTPDRTLPTPKLRLRRKWTSVTNEIWIDFVFAIASGLFFVYGLIVLSFEDMEVWSRYDDEFDTMHRLQSVAQFGPTIFPILFAAVFGRAVKAIMLWRLEEGERLGFLDLLAGSTTVMNTLLTQINLRMLSLSGMLLTVLWALSPAGSQASSRVLVIKNNTFTDIGSVDYFSDNQSYCVG